jgi:F-type H+-transporting ATPase subunit epsilon
MKLEVVTPERKVLDETVDAVTIPTRNGEIGVLPEHAPLISGLKSGILTYTSGAATNKMIVSGGFVEVGPNRVSVLADVAEFANEIDASSARNERDEIEKSLGTWSGSVEDFEAARDRLERAEARLELAAAR